MRPSFFYNICSMITQKELIKLTMLPLIALNSEDYVD